MSVFGSIEGFQQAQRMIKPLAESNMIPEAYRGNVPNCMVAMEMSHRIQISVLEVMQNMQIVKGNVGWKSEYVINKINASGQFKRNLRFVFSDDRKSCYAIATAKDGEELRGTTVTMVMAEAEGWLNKPGSKWKTMPEQMLMYRAATFFCRVHCPEVLAGVQTADEIIDITSEPVVTETQAIKKVNDLAKPESEADGYAYEDIPETELETPQAAKDMDFTHENVTQEEDQDF